MPPIFRRARFSVFAPVQVRSEEHTSELQSHSDLVCRLLLEKKKNRSNIATDAESFSNNGSRTNTGGSSGTRTSGPCWIKHPAGAYVIVMDQLPAGYTVSLGH